MFNFKVFSQGLVDNELSDKAFRLLSLLLNNLSLEKTNEIDMFYDFIMEKLNWSRSTAIRNMNELVSKGYVIKEVCSNKGNKKPIKIKVDAKYCTDITEVSVKSDTEFESECQNGQKVSVKSDTLYKSTLNKTSTSTGEKPVKIDFKWLNEQIAIMKSTYNRQEYFDTDNAIAKYVQVIDRSQLSQKQEKIYDEIMTRWCDIADQREMVFA